MDGWMNANCILLYISGIDKFYQPNSGLRSSRTWDEAIYTPKLDGFLANNIGELYRIVPKNSGFLLDP